MNAIARLSLALLTLALLSGCWNSKDIQNLDYATAIGLDYANGKFITYVQFLNFSNVGRNEMLEIGKKLPVWVSKGEGDSLAESLSSIYATSQMRIFWGHVRAIVYSERILRRGAKDAYDSINRFGDVRYNIYVFGTKEKLSDIFVQQSVFHISPLDTILFSPEQTYDQRSIIMPKTSNQAVSQLNEPGNPIFLPSLGIDRKTWREDKKPNPKLKIDGAYFFKGDKMTAWLSEEELIGTRWTQSKLRRSMVQIPKEGEPDASLVMINPRYRVHSGVTDGKPAFELKVAMDATLHELFKDMSISELERRAAEIIRDEIMESFHIGLKKEVDVLNLEETLYRDHPKQWHKLRDADPDCFMLDRDSIRSVKVSVHLRNTGKYKGRVE